MNPKTRSGRAHLLTLGVMVLGLVGAALGLLSKPGQTPQPKPTPEQVTFFETRIRPLLADKCYACHGKQTQLSGLRLDTLAGFQKGGTSGPLVVPGDPDKSLIVQAVRQTGSLKMPQGGKLKPGEIADIEAWVKMGAPWPDEAGQSKTDTLWSLKPVKKPDIPKMRDGAWVRNPIDAIVLAGMEAKHLHPAPSADRRTLIRRVTYDLTGLPPTVAEVQAFLTDHSPDAYEKVVDRLLGSPRYGERWARQWLDLARYSDTKGYVFNEDRNYPNAYTYRDWVIKSINDDLPYDQFVIDQLAADRLPRVKDGDDKADLAALGFLTLGRRFLNSQPDIIDDRIDVTMRGLQGLTVACARCHDHKFDPIPTQDYYSLYAVFASSDEVSAPISPKAISDPWEQYNQKATDLEGRIDQLLVAQVKLLREKNKTTDLGSEAKGALQSLGEGALPMGHEKDVLVKAFEPSAKGQLEEFQKQLDDLRKSAPPTPEFAMAMTDDPHPHDGVVFQRGDPNRHGAAAPRRFLACLSPGEERPHWTADSGRLELAEAIASKDDPLTARVFVNRVWQGHFGAGIVRTPSDFGHQGEKPTDPKLLDYLAWTFMEDGWSMRKLHRLIVTSATYRQASDVSPTDLNTDPDNQTWCRQNRRRLDLEEMRDSVMFVADKLDLSRVGGKSVDLWSQPFTERRALYGFIERQNLPGIFRTFDFATPDSTSPKRFVTTVPQQGLFFMNSAFVMEQAEALADRPEIKDARDDAQRVRRIYQALFQRLPDSDEAALGSAYLHRTGKPDVDAPASIWQYGFGGFDQVSGRTGSFTPFAEFSNQSYHPTKQFPDPTLGYLVLNSGGGHPGRDQNHAAIRRWTAPADVTIRIEGTLAHHQAQGDGVRARIVSSGSGLLGEWQAHNSEDRTEVASVLAKKGETLDFILDPKASDAYDSFQWAPIIRSVDGKQLWDANSGFGPPPGPPISRLRLYVQALMMTNEFMFID